MTIPEEENSDLSTIARRQIVPHVFSVSLHVVYNLLEGGVLQDYSPRADRAAPHRQDQLQTASVRDPG